MDGHPTRAELAKGWYTCPMCFGFVYLLPLDVPLPEELSPALLEFVGCICPLPYQRITLDTRK